MAEFVVPHINLGSGAGHSHTSSNKSSFLDAGLSLVNSALSLSRLSHGDPTAVLPAFTFGAQTARMVSDLVNPTVEAIAAANSSGIGSGSASSGYSGSGSGLIAVSPSRVPLSIDGAPITSAVSGIDDQESRLNAWTEMMANSSHQREVQDLMKAGLNPVLSARYGGSDVGSAANVAVDMPSYSASGAVKSKSGFLGLNPIENPRNGLEVAYNLVVNHGDQAVNSALKIARLARILG